MSTKGSAGASDSFEAVLSEISESVRKIEEGELPLDQVVELFKRAATKIRNCTEMLAEVEQQLKILEKDILKPLSSTD